MAQKIVVEHGEWVAEDLRFKYARELELGNILFFPQIPFDFPQEEIDFLLAQDQGASKRRKNIAYKPQLDKITNHISPNKLVAEKMHQVLKNYSHRVTNFLSQLLSPYARHWQLDYASFRPFQEAGRRLRTRARNDLLHVDAFPTRPMHGARILRFFTNINPKEPRKWITAEHFRELAGMFGDHGVNFPETVGHAFADRMKSKMIELMRKAKIKITQRSPYDNFMLNLHHFMKENNEYQANSIKDAWDFPPNSCWMVYTDLVSHAALSGQYALEQTLIIPQHTLLLPDQSPVSILERMTGRNLVLEMVKQ